MGKEEAINALDAFHAASDKVYRDHTPEYVGRRITEYEFGKKVEPEILELIKARNKFFAYLAFSLRANRQEAQKQNPETLSR